ncbi:MAG: SH3 domain-containing protein [Lachnospiraceae bacterium]|nr:SH3 domain-containing protein [Lachnospiraceae bacterium]
MKKRSLKSLISIGAALTLTALIAISSFADSVVMGSDGIRIRSSASTSAAVVTTGASGDEYKIVETVSGDDGNTWYKIQVDGSTTGYVRGDLVKVKKEENAEANNTADETPNTASSLAPTEPTAISPATATIGGNSSVNIRSGAGVGYEKVGSIDAGTSITLIGEANDSSGNKWYQFKCDSQGIEGYIRSDLITITQEAAPAEAENPEGAEGEFTENPEETPEVVEPEPEVNEPQGGDYEIKYETDSDGVYQYYLYDYPNGNRQKVVELLEAVNTLNTRYQDASAKLTTFKIITILFGVLAVLAIGAAVIFFIKSRNAGEVEYYEDDFEYDDYNDKPKTKRRRQEEEIEEDYPKPQSKKLPNEYAEDQRTSSKDGGRALRNESRRSYNEDRAPKDPSSRSHEERRNPAADERPARRPRKPQNFLADDDEFEFEFLNMDDKDN